MFSFGKSAPAAPSGEGNTPAAPVPQNVSLAQPEEAKIKHDITGAFDPSGLERAVKAMKELKDSPHAKEAFQVVKIQEATKQKEISLAMEEAQTARANALIEKARVEGDERRKVASHMQDEERRTAQYKAQLEAEAYQKKLEDQRKKNEEWLAMQQQQFERQEQRRKETELELEQIRARRAADQSKRDMELQSHRIQEETRGRITQERENADVHLRELRVKAAEHRDTVLKTVEATLGSIGGAFNTLLTDKDKLYTFVGGSFALALAIYGTRTGTGLAGKYFESVMGKPSLVRETSRWTWRNGFKNIFARKANDKFHEKIILPAELTERLEWTSNSLMQAKNNGTPFRHVLVHGPPGTGKTLFARALARESGLDYAIMSGGDVGPLGKDAVNEINKLFEWANTSKNGLVLFVDEAEAFLRKGRGGSNAMSEDVRNALSAFLSHTGTETDKFCIVMATNIKDAFDSAVLDRVDEVFEFPLPGLNERVRMMDQFLNEYLRRPTKKGKVITIAPELDDAYWKMVAEKTEGLSGRQLAKLVINYQSAVMGSGANQLTKGMADVVLDWRLKNLDKDRESY